MDFSKFLAEYWWAIVLVIIFFSGLFTINQGYIGVITMFGKYRRVARPGLNFKIPILETVLKRVSVQNRSVELEFQAVTADQANVYFKSMLLYSVQNSEEETIKKVAFKFIAEKDLMQALIRTIEGNIRSFVATKKQAEVLGLRREIVQYVKVEVDHSLEEWGYHLQDLQINDITFDKLILDSMSKVVASNNLKAAAENEGQALLITKTKQAEVILFSMWTEAIKNFAEYGKGNVIFLDGSPDGMEGTMKQIQALMVKQAGTGK